MHVRVTTVTGASDVDGGLVVLRDQVVPEMRKQKGFGGLSASGDRAAGVITVLSAWESEADLVASESAADKARDEAMRVLGGEARVELYEQSVWEVGDVPPGPGAKLHLRHVKVDRGRIDENIEFFGQIVVPDMKATPGFRGVRLLVDRATGEGRVGTVWADDASLAGALAKAEERRAIAADRGVEFGEDRVLEVLFAAM